jgi:NADH-quinone oxidoreductase subunit G
VIQAAANVAWALCAAGVPAKLLLVLPECNSLGAALLGGGDLEAAALAVRSGTAETVIVLENDLTRRAGTETVEAILSAPHMIVLDSISNATTARAEVVLPAATFAETNGTLVNNEGRAQRFFQVFEPGDEVRGSWQWLEELGAGQKTFDEVVAAMVRAMPELAGVAEAAPGAGFRVAGEKIPRQPLRFSGRTSVPAEASAEERSVPADADTALAFSMEGYAGIPPAALVARYWRPGWNSNQAINKFQQEVGGPPRGGDAGRRLFDAAGLREKPYYSAAPGPFERRAGELWVVGSWHVFGSEELSVLSPGVAELSPEPYLGLNPVDAAALGAKEGDLMELRIAGGPAYRLLARLRPALVPGVATVPAGLGELAAAELPAWGRAATIGRTQGGAA